MIAKKQTAKIKIQQMQFEDLLRVFAIGEKVFTAEKWSNLYRTWDEYALLEKFNSDTEFCLTAKINDRIIGFAVGSIIEKKRSAWSYGYLEWIAIAPNHSQKGVGRKLLNKMTRLFIQHGARMMLVDTEIDNDPAINFFEKNGFRKEDKQLYLSKNLTEHPLYKRSKD